MDKGAQPTNRTNDDGDVNFKTKAPKDDVKRVTWPKVWVLLFTCAVTRVVHLEVVKDCSVNAYWFAIRRF